MKIIRSIDELMSLRTAFRAQGRTVGLVPTMGALHEGHIALLKRARHLCDVSVMSVFVNPTQFGPGEDFEKYPRPFDADCDMAEKNGCDVVFAPLPQDMYPKHFATFVTVEGITGRLCGAARPGHFRGVTTVVMKFFNIVSPDIAVFGQKDAQQAIVLRRMGEDLNCPVRIVVEPTVREKDGLAMSSRNRYLTESERLQAATLFKGLSAALQLYETGERSALLLREATCSACRFAPLLVPEYVEIVDVKTLEPLVTVDDGALIAVAARTKETGTRLIDNIVLGGTL
jgi:pantoate--beta-alanine ligase